MDRGLGVILTNDHPWLAREWHPICRVPGEDGLQSGELFGTRYLVATVAGRTMVTIDACPHRGGRLSDGVIVDGCVRCPYHGWQFDTDGQCTAIPAIGDSTIPWRANLVPLDVHVALGLVWIRPEPASGDPDAATTIAVPEWNAPGIGTAWLPDVTLACSAGQFIDNFLDIAHFPVVHAGTFGADEHDEVPDLDVETLDRRTLRLRHAHTIANREDPLVATGEHPLIQPRLMEYTVRAPFQARLRIELPLTGVENTIVVIASPTSRDRTTLFTVLLRNDLDTDAPENSEVAQDAIDYEMTVLAEDLAILEHLADDGLQLDLPAQVHTRADRFTVEYRRLLTQLIAAS